MLSTAMLTFTSSATQYFSVTPLLSGSVSIRFLPGGAAAAEFVELPDQSFILEAQTGITVSCDSDATIFFAQVAVCSLQLGAAPSNGASTLSISLSGPGYLSSSELHFTDATEKQFSYTSAPPTGVAVISFYVGTKDHTQFAAPGSLSFSAVIGKSIQVECTPPGPLLAIGVG
jgi:hypothetical protein